MENYTTGLLVLSGLLFLLGFYGFIIRKNALASFICLEIMLNAANLCLAAFASYYQNIESLVLIIAVIVLAAVEAVVGLSFIWLMNSINGHTRLDWLNFITD